LTNKINIKARIDRHSRIIKDSIWLTNKISSILYHNKLWYKIVVFSMVFIMPIYPAFASLVYQNTEVDFTRDWYIDESSIIDSYMETNTNEIYQSKDEFLTVSTVLNDERDLNWVNEIIKYKVENWDSIASIAADFKVHPEHILWANNFDEKHTIKTGDIIKVPPVSWLLHTIRAWQTLADIAGFYWIEAEIISKQNSLDTKWLISWRTIIIPWARKPKEEPIIQQVEESKYTQNTWKNPTKNTVKNTWKNITKNSTKNTVKNTAYVNKTGYYSLSAKPSYHTFYWWNCTRHVAKYKKVNWWWNAKDWLYNASSAGVATWNTPTLWSIVVFNGSWYNPKYGHVWIVMKIDWNSMVISDMNYRSLWEVTNRNVSLNDRAIRWYIYAE